MEPHELIDWRKLCAKRTGLKFVIFGPLVYSLLKHLGRHRDSKNIAKRDFSERTISPDRKNFPTNATDQLFDFLNRNLACCRFRRHRVRCFAGTGGGSWSDGSLRE